MARQWRIQYEDAVYHVISRAVAQRNNRNSIVNSIYLLLTLSQGLIPTFL